MNNKSSSGSKIMYLIEMYYFNAFRIKKIREVANLISQNENKPVSFVKAVIKYISKDVNHKFKNAWEQNQQKISSLYNSGGLSDVLRSKSNSEMNELLSFNSYGIAGFDMYMAFQRKQVNEMAWYLGEDKGHSIPLEEAMDTYSKNGLCSEFRDSWKNNLDKIDRLYLNGELETILNEKTNERMHMLLN